MIESWNFFRAIIFCAFIHDQLRHCDWGRRIVLNETKIDLLVPVLWLPKTYKLTKRNVIGGSKITREPYLPPQFF